MNALHFPGWSIACICVDIQQNDCRKDHAASGQSQVLINMRCANSSIVNNHTMICLTLFLLINLFFSQMLASADFLVTDCYSYF